jgi:LAS superfamily LD-carboxypeptidase LdcB
MKTRKINRPLFFVILFLVCMFPLRGTILRIADERSQQKGTKGLNTSLYSTSKPGSIWWIVNKNRSLPPGYVPPNLSIPNVTLRLDRDNESMKVNSSITKNIEEMFAASEKAGNPLLFASGYRSEEYQRQLYQSYTEQGGQAFADKTSAKPGTSEHQTGYAFDVCELNKDCVLEKSFADTKAGIWLKNNAHKYGFIIRYLDGKENETGYDYEPWHLRYVGAELATELHNSNRTMEDFFGLK